MSHIGTSGAVVSSGFHKTISFRESRKKVKARSKLQDFAAQTCAGIKAVKFCVQTNLTETQIGGCSGPKLPLTATDNCVVGLAAETSC